MSRCQDLFSLDSYITMAIVTRKGVANVAKYVLLFTLTHSYILICSLIYQQFEGFDESKQLVDQVEYFLLHTKLDAKKNPDEYLKVFHEEKEKEKYWELRKIFNSFPRAYIFTLASYTTLGSRHMMLQTWQSHLFYILTTPLGVVLYYLMIHISSNLYIQHIQLAVMLIFRQEDRNISDKARDLYEKLKLVIFTFILTLLFLLLLGMTSLITGNSYAEELHYIIDAALTINSPSHYFSLVYKLDYVDAILSTLQYFMCIFFAYINLYAAINLFRNHDLKSILLLCGKEELYEKVSTVEDRTDDSMISAWNKVASTAFKRTGEGGAANFGSSLWDGTEATLFQKDSTVREKQIEDDNGREKVERYVPLKPLLKK